MNDARTTTPSFFRQSLTWLVCGMVVLAVCVALLKKKSPENASAKTAATLMPNVADIREPQRTPVITPSTMPTVPVSPEALHEIGIVTRLMRDYFDRLGEFPVGSNAEITLALMGKNAKQIKFVVPGEAAMNDHNQLIDHWKTPFFFHNVSADRLEIRSAGPDRQLWTTDDISLFPR